MSKLALVRVRGQTGINKPTKDTLNMLKLYKNNYCVVVDKTPVVLGMIKKINRYITWGEVSEETLKLLEKRKEKTKDKKGKVIEKKFFRLNPPKKGFGRKGIKKSFREKGALGYRGLKINDLIKRMV